MSVRARIKILKCTDFQDAEDKVNDFLAFNKEIQQLVNIDYRLEYNVVILEYNAGVNNNMRLSTTSSSSSTTIDEEPSYDDSEPASNLVPVSPISTHPITYCLSLFLWWWKHIDPESLMIAAAAAVEPNMPTLPLKNPAYSDLLSSTMPPTLE